MQLPILKDQNQFLPNMMLYQLSFLNYLPYIKLM